MVFFNEKFFFVVVNFFIRILFVFFFEDGFIFVDKVIGELYFVDFYDLEEWV